MSPQEFLLYNSADPLNTFDIYVWQMYGKEARPNEYEYRYEETVELFS